MDKQSISIDTIKSKFYDAQSEASNLMNFLVKQIESLQKEIEDLKKNVSN